ncbi:MAG: TonB-dependent receptor [Spongiibacteraceae bacterium]
MRRKFVGGAIAVCSSAFFLDGYSHADTAIQIPPVDLLAAHYRLDTVVVSASRAATPLNQTPVAIAQLDRASIDDKAPAFTGEVLNTIPGVHMTDLGNEQHSMSIRQPMTTAAVYLYLEDGIPLRPTGLFNHNSLYEVNLQGTGNVEVMKGPASSLYGSNSVGGTVNFLTQAPSLNFTAKLGAQTSDEGYWRTDANVSGTSGDFGGRVSGYVSRRNGGWQDYNDAEKESLTARGDWQASDSTTVKSVFTYNHLYTDMPGSLFETDFKTNPGKSYNHFTYREVYASRASIVVDGDWFEVGGTTLTAHARDNSTEQNPSYSVRIIGGPNSTVANGRLNDNDFTSLGFDARQQFGFSWLDSRLVVGLSADDTDNDYVEDNTAIVRDPASGEYLRDSFLSSRRDYNVQLENRAAYAQYEFSPLRDVRVVVGGRYDKTTYDYTNHFAPSTASGAPSETRDFNHFSPKAGVIWSPLPEHSFYLNHAEGFVPPEVSGLYGSLAVPNLKESVFINNELGWRATFLKNRLRLDAAIYRLDGEDEVVSYAISTGLSEPRNAGSTRHQGIEFGAAWNITPEWQADVAIAYSEHEYCNYQASPTLDYSGNDIPLAPAWVGNTEVRWTPAFWSGFSAELEWSYLGAYEMDNANTVDYGGFNLFNLRLAYDWPVWRLWLKGANLADKHYAETASSSFSGVGPYLPDAQNSYSPGNPRTVSLGVTFLFGE